MKAASGTVSKRKTFRATCSSRWSSTPRPSRWCRTSPCDRFVGTGQNPIAVSQAEIDRIKGRIDGTDEELAEVPYHAGDHVSGDRRSVQRVHGGGGRGERGAPEAQGDGLDFRPPDAGRARLPPGEEPLARTRDLRRGCCRRSRCAPRCEGAAGRRPVLTGNGAVALPRRGDDMAKAILAQVKLQCPAGQANPAPPVGPALGQHGVNIMEFCKAFNARTQSQQGLIIRWWSRSTATGPSPSSPRHAAAILLKRAAGIATASGSERKKVGTVTRSSARDRRIEDARSERQRRGHGDADHRGHRAQHGHHGGIGGSLTR